MLCDKVYIMWFRIHQTICKQNLAHYLTLRYLCYFHVTHVMYMWKQSTHHVRFSRAIWWYRHNVHTVISLSIFLLEIENKILLRIKNNTKYKIRLWKVYHQLFSNDFLCIFSLKNKNQDTVFINLKKTAQTMHIQETFKTFRKQSLKCI